MLRGIRLTKKPASTSTAVIETMVLTVSGILLGYWFTPQAAFFSVPGFTWLLVGPFLSGLRYGFAYALNSALLLIGLMWAASQFYPGWNSESFSSPALSLFFIAIIAGEFRNYWERQIKKLQAASQYLDHRLGEVSNAFNMLNISHEKLAQRVASRSTLRDSILAVRTHMMKAKWSDSDIASLSALILRIFADYGSVQQAGLYTLNDSGEINTTAIANFGGQFEIYADDLLLQKVLETRKTTSLKPELATHEEYSKLILLAIPLIDVFGKLWGLVLVNKMPFRAFRPDNIRMSAILGGHIADLISMRFETKASENVDLQYFILQIKRCMSDVIAFDIPGCLVGIQLENDMHAKAMSSLILGLQRGLDNAWAVKNISGIPCIFILLPLTDIAGADGYKLRLQQMIKENYGYSDLQAAGIKFHKKNLASTENIQELMLSFFQQLNVDQDSWTQQIYWQK